MNIKGLIRRLPLLGPLSYWIRPASGGRGSDDCREIAELIDPQVIFDVGASRGQSAEQYLGAFPRATIYCFEPSAKAAQILRDRLGNRVNVFNIGLSSETRTASLSSAKSGSTLSTISETGGETIQLQTIDAFCNEQSIPRIDFLKIDTEGHDLEVLRGADRLLQGHVSIVQVEAGMNPENKLHVPFEILKKHLEKLNFRLYGIYEQVDEWPTNQPHLRRTNPIFISKDLQTAQHRSSHRGSR